MEDDDKICYCFHVTKRKIVNYLKRERPPVVSMISDCLAAGTGCGWCRPTLQKLHGQYVVGRQDGVSDLNPQDYANARKQYLKQGKGIAAPGAATNP